MQQVTPARKGKGKDKGKGKGKLLGKASGKALGKAKSAAEEMPQDDVWHEVTPGATETIVGDRPKTKPEEKASEEAAQRSADVSNAEQARHEKLIEKRKLMLEALQNRKKRWEDMQNARDEEEHEKRKPVDMQAEAKDEAEINRIVTEKLLQHIGKEHVQKLNQTENHLFACESKIRRAEEAENVIKKLAEQLADETRRRNDTENKFEERVGANRDKINLLEESKDILSEIVKAAVREVIDVPGTTSAAEKNEGDCEEPPGGENCEEPPGGESDTGRRSASTAPDPRDKKNEGNCEEPPGGESDSGRRSASRAPSNEQPDPSSNDTRGRSNVKMKTDDEVFVEPEPDDSISVANLDAKSVHRQYQRAKCRLTCRATGSFLGIALFPRFPHVDYFSKLESLPDGQSVLNKLLDEGRQHNTEDKRNLIGKLEDISNCFKDSIDDLLEFRTCHLYNGVPVPLLLSVRLTEVLYTLLFSDGHEKNDSAGELFEKMNESIAKNGFMSTCLRCFDKKCFDVCEELQLDWLSEELEMHAMFILECSLSWISPDLVAKSCKLHNIHQCLGKMLLRERGIVEKVWGSDLLKNRQLARDRFGKIAAILECLYLILVKHNNKESKEELLLVPSSPPCKTMPCLDSISMDLLQHVVVLSGDDTPCLCAHCTQKPKSNDRRQSYFFKDDLENDASAAVDAVATFAVKLLGELLLCRQFAASLPAEKIASDIVRIVELRPISSRFAFAIRQLLLQARQVHRQTAWLETNSDTKRFDIELRQEFKRLCLADKIYDKTYAATRDHCKKDKDIYVFSSKEKLRELIGHVEDVLKRLNYPINFDSDGASIGSEGSHASGKLSQASSLDSKSAVKSVRGKLKDLRQSLFGSCAVPQFHF